MRAIAPRTGAPECTLAEEQEEYQPITVAMYGVNDSTSRIVLTRWTLTAEERTAIAAGEDIYSTQMLGEKDLMAPMTIQVGPGGYRVAADGSLS
jgi:hypothetical protein